jgi:hypothetical protein
MQPKSFYPSCILVFFWLCQSVIFSMMSFFKKI